MSVREQFLGWGQRDHIAVCRTCRLQHLIPKGEQIDGRPWMDWLAKHPAPGHVTFVVPRRERSRLDDFLDRMRELMRAPAYGHNADVKLAYASSATLTLTATGLASDTNLLAGRESSAVSNSSNYPEVIFAAKATTGTSPTTGRVIELWQYGSCDDTPVYPDVFDGTESAETVTSADIKASALRLIDVLPTSNTSNVTYWTGPKGMAQLQGGLALPKNWGIFLTHSTGVNLNATASNHAFYYTPVYQTVI
jgi:hypothetical protein